jgi:hypothetical protein
VSAGNSNSAGIAEPLEQRQRRLLHCQLFCVHQRHQPELPHQVDKGSALGEPLVRSGFGKPERENLAGLVPRTSHQSSAWWQAGFSEHRLAGGDVGRQVHAHTDRHHA